MATVDFTLEDLREIFATKEDLATFATKSDLAAFATKDDLTGFATKNDLTRFATRDDLANFATRDDLLAFASKQDVQEIVDHAIGVAKDELQGELKHITKMLEEDYLAESGRLTRVSRRLDQTQVRLKRPVADRAAHRV